MNNRDIVINEAIARLQGAKAMRDLAEMHEGDEDKVKQVQALEKELLQDAMDLLGEELNELFPAA